MSESEDIRESGNICPACHKRVFFNERGPPFLTKIYHDKCFKCTSCSKVLYLGGFVDHLQDPFCEPCYERLFAGNRKMYSKPDQQLDGEIDTSDPLKQIKSNTKSGKLDIKKFSQQHNIDETLKKSHSK